MVRVSVLFRLWKTCLERTSWTSEEVGMFIFCWLIFSYNNSYHSSVRCAPFEIIEKVRHVAYQLDLSKELNGVHDTFHVSNLKQCLA
ncbi:hypothetical protein Tco_1366893, partial [Tanacetum coccineum]